MFGCLFNFLEHKLGVPKPSKDVMPNAHAHHIVYVTEKGAEQQYWSKLSRDILEKHGIDPYWGKENLVWAPHITGQHTKENEKYIYDQLHTTDIEGGDITKNLKELGKRAANHR